MDHVALETWNHLAWKTNIAWKILMHKRWFDNCGEDGYLAYQYRNIGITYFVNNKEVDNSDIVSYNPHLSKMFDSHINVEVCARNRYVKYIHQYIFKEYDLTTIVLIGVDDIHIYLDVRYIGPVEAAKRLLGFIIHQKNQCGTPGSSFKRVPQSVH